MDAAAQRRSGARALLLVLAFSVEGALADIKPSFVWGLGAFTGVEFPECGQMQITVGTLPSITTAAVPPYTLMAYEPGGITTAQNLGSDPSNLMWTVDHKAGAQLLISMADSAGNSGGISKFVYNVVSSATTNSSCHPISPKSPLSLTTNATSSLNTCDVLPLKISGGQRPYTVTIVSTLDYIVTNVTMGNSYDTYNWVSKASPNSSLIATVSDAAGTYSASTALLKTGGGTDHTCNGMSSTQLDSTGRVPPLQSDNGTTTAASNSSGRSSTGAIAGGVVGGLVLIAALVGGVLFFLRRRRARAGGARPYFDDQGGSGLEGMTGIVPFRPDGYTDHPPNSSGITPFAPFRDTAPYSGSHGKTGITPLTPAFDTSPSTQPTSGSSIERLVASGSGGVAAIPITTLDGQNQQTGKRDRRPRPPPQERTTVYQHADISDIVELPPAYRDRTP